MLRKILSFILFGLFFSAGFACFADEKISITASAGDEIWFPISYRDPQTDRMIGLSFDVLDELVRRLPMEAEAERLPWNRMLAKLRHGMLDMALAIYKSEERQEFLLFSEPYFANEIRIFVKKGNEFTIERLEDLIPYRGIVPAGASFGDAFDAMAASGRLELLETYGGQDAAEHKWAQLLISGHYDYLLKDYMDGMTFLRKHDIQDEVVPLDFVVDRTDVHIALSRKSKNSGMLQQINEAIIEMKNDGTLEGILRRHMP